jgi:hypothetical protein
VPEITYVAGRRLKGIPRNGELVDVAARQPVPEAAKFRKLKILIKAGFVVRLIDGVPDKPSKQRARQLGLTPYRRHDKPSGSVAAEAGSAASRGGEAGKPGSDRPQSDKKPEDSKPAEVKPAAKKKTPKKKAPKKKAKKGTRRITRREG